METEEVYSIFKLDTGEFLLLNETDNSHPYTILSEKEGKKWIRKNS